MKSTSSLSAFYQAARQTHLPVALWRLPQGQESQALVDLSGRADSQKIDFERSPPGFAFAPFLNEHGTKTRFLKASLWFNQDHIHALTPPLNDIEVHHQDQFWQAYQDSRLTPSKSTWEMPPLDQHTNGSEVSDYICSRSEFCTLVDKAVRYIKQNPIRKIVAARAIETGLPPHFNPFDMFQALCQRYDHAFVSLVVIPGIGTWLGATPETLLNIEHNHAAASPPRLQTVALAGTQALPSSRCLDDVHWRPKEIEEQALVSDYIRTFFQQLGLPQVMERGPYTVQAGNLVHLRSQFTVTLSKQALFTLANQILDKLHPTSAVCGMPKTEALNFILTHENHQRRFYSGFLGPIHCQDQSQLFVNLRCMQLKKHSALLYVGAGITQDSDPEAEWEETELKSRTLLSILN